MVSQDLKDTLDFVHSELNRLETMTGTLSMTEKEHFTKLSNFDDKGIMDIAVEEQSAARQLGTMKQMCLAMAQRVDDIKGAIDRGGVSGENGQ